MSDHAGTHIDALSHWSKNMRLFGGANATEKESPRGFSALGAESIRPIICKGVLLDVPRSKDVKCLRDFYPIGRKDLLECAKSEGVTIDKGDALLVRTGFGSYWQNETRYLRAAGVTNEANVWLVQKGVRLVGADNMAWDLSTEKNPRNGAYQQGHIRLIAESGIHIIENMFLEELSRDNVFRFTFVCLPIKIKGATGSPVRPVALVQDEFPS